MKKILVLLALAFSILLCTADVHVMQLATVGVKRTVVTSAALTYADTDQHGFGLDNGMEYYEIYYYGAYAIEYQIIYTGNPNDVDLTLSAISSTQSLTCAEVIAQFDEADDWAIETIDLNTSGGTSTKCGIFPESLLNGRFFYFTYQYSGDPGKAPKVAIFLTRN